MKLIIAGGRDYYFTQHDRSQLDALLAAQPISEIVCGGAPGADSDGAAWAHSHALKVCLFPANWQQFGRSAGPRRNQQMAAYADALALFLGGAGSANMLAQAQRYALQIFDLR